jgi:hypothetical protein
MATTPDDDLDFNDTDPLDQDETVQFLREKLAATDDKPDDVEADDFAADVEEDPNAPDVVDAKKGTDLASKAKLAADTKSRTTDTKPEAQPAPADKPVEDNAQPAKTEAPAPADIAALVADLPEDKRQAVTQRLTAADAVLRQFTTPAAKASLQSLADTPEQAVTQMLYLANFAREKPDEYVAWVIKESANGDVEKAMNAAAKHLGLKVIKDTDEDDDFVDPEVLALRKEIADLKGKSGPSFGPFSQQRQVQMTQQQALDNLINERDEAGQPKRPHWSVLEPRITALATEARAKEGRALTVEDIAKLYDVARNEAMQVAGVSSAATSQPDVSKLTQQAAAAEKARRASKSIDGGGQGARRRPALDQDAPLEAVIGQFLKAQQS